MSSGWLVTGRRSQVEVNTMDRKSLLKQYLNPSPTTYWRCVSCMNWNNIVLRIISISGRVLQRTPKTCGINSHCYHNHHNIPTPTHPFHSQQLFHFHTLFCTNQILLFTTNNWITILEQIRGLFFLLRKFTFAEQQQENLPLSAVVVLQYG